MVGNSRENYVSEKLTTYKGDSRNFWKSMELILPNKKTTTIQVVHDPDKDEMVGGKEAATLINNYFSTVGERLGSTIPPPQEEFWPQQSNCEFEWGNNIFPPDILYVVDQMCPSY